MKTLISETSHLLPPSLDCNSSCSLSFQTQIQELVLLVVIATASFLSSFSETISSIYFSRFSANTPGTFVAANFGQNSGVPIRRRTANQFARTNSRFSNKSANYVTISITKLCKMRSTKLHFSISPYFFTVVH